MKTWEVYKIVLENPKAKFRRMSDGEVYYFSDQTHCIRRDGGNGSMLTDRYDEDWELVREPVDFMTAINSGKAIRGENFTLANSGELFLGHQQLSPADINGKWYIEE